MTHRARRGKFKPTTNHQREDSSTNTDIDIDNKSDEFGLSTSCVCGGGGSGSGTTTFGENADTDEHNCNRSSQSIILSGCHCHCRRKQQLRNYLKACFQSSDCLKNGCASHRMYQQQQQCKPTRRRPSSTFFIGATIIIMVSFSFTFLHQLDAYVREYQGPLDHLASDLLKPYYGMLCPIFPHRHDENLGNSDSAANQSLNAGAWNCKSDHENDVAMPRMFMIGARDEDEDTYDDWMTALHQIYSVGTNGNALDPQHSMPIHLERINTLEMSNKYALSGGALQIATVISDNQHLNLSTAVGESSTNSMNPNRSRFLCRKMKWEHRLFAVYQTIFSHLLATYPNDTGFVIIEDDAVLMSPYEFVEEVCHAHNKQMEFYSLYRSPSQWKGKSRSPSCIYVHGTVAFYIQRSLMEVVVRERRRDWFCRFPIDLYILSMGPWYASTREIVGHLDTGRVGSIEG